MPRPQFTLRALLGLTMCAAVTCWTVTTFAYATMETLLYVLAVSAVGIAALLAVIGWKG
jgi:hypothetical protein